VDICAILAREIKREREIVVAMVDSGVSRNLERLVQEKAEKDEMVKENGEVVTDGTMVMNLEPPTNPMVTSLLTDMYQITMAYAYWKAGKQNDRAVFDLFHRKNPFGGEYTVFAGLEECIRFAANYHFKEDEISFLRSVLPSTCEEGFFSYLVTIDCSDVEIYAMPEGSVVFPKVPLIRVEGPLLIAQLLETTFLTLVNYASLVATNAARHRRVAGKDKILLEFGLRRAQGPDGGISASKYCYLGGFDATSNVDAGRRFGIPVKGTNSHAFVSSFMGFDEIIERSLPYAEGGKICEDFVHLTQLWLSRMQDKPSLRDNFHETNQSELAAFCSYAFAFPTAFQALVDTYDVLRSGVPNFCAVALALHDLGYKALGIRLDSGDLSYFSIETRKFFHLVEKEFHVVGFGKLTIVASNDINEATLDALNKQVNICSSQPLVLCCKFLLGVEVLKSKLAVQSSIHIIMVWGRSLSDCSWSPETLCRRTCDDLSSFLGMGEFGRCRDMRWIRLE